MSDEKKDTKKAHLIPMIGTLMLVSPLVFIWGRKKSRVRESIDALFYFKNGYLLFSMKFFVEAT